MKKSNIILLCLLLVHSLLSAQTATITYSEEEEVEPQKLVNANSCFFITYKDVKGIWKIGYSNFSNTSIVRTPISPTQMYNIKGIDMGIEKRLTTGLSLGIYMRSGFNQSIKELPLYDQGIILSADLFTTSFNAEARWYFQKRKQVQQGLSGNNLSGFYIGLNSTIDLWSIEVNQFKLGEEVVRNLKLVTGITHHNFLSTGWQQQTKNNGYVNFRLGSGFSRPTKDINSLTIKENGDLQLSAANKWNWFLDYQVTLGTILWGRGKDKLPEDCSILEYYEEEKRLWKFDLFNIVDGFSNEGIQGKFSMEYEQKLGSSLFSINPLAELYYNIPFSDNPSNHQFNLGAELRYYYNMKRLIRKGLANNGLFASYFATYIYHSPSFSTRPRIGLQFGSQQRLFKKVYLDLKILYDVQTHAAEDNFLLDRMALLYKVGFAF